MFIATTVKDVPSSLFIVKYADYLKRSGQIRNPSWLEVVKTGIQKKIHRLIEIGFTLD